LGTVNETDEDRYNPYAQKVPGWIVLVLPAFVVGFTGALLLLVFWAASWGDM